MFNPPYPSYSDAQGSIAADSAGCLIFYGGSGSGGIANSTFNGTTFHIDYSGPQANQFAASISVKSGAVISIPYTVTTDGVDIVVGAQLYSCSDLTFITEDTLNTFSGTLNLTVPADGIYFINIYFTAATTPGTSYDWVSDATCSDVWWINPVIALWDDSGTTRYLDACPKLFLPPLTESTGNWYVDATAAQTAIDDLTSNCVGYTESLTNLTSFTATDGGSTLTLAQVLTVGATTSPAMWGSVNGVGGATITVTATVGAGTAGLNVNIYDYTGTLVQASGATSSPWVSSGLPYEGRYIVNVSTTSTLTTVAMSAVISSSGALTVNDVQAMYDIGLECPGRLDCV